MKTKKTVLLKFYKCNMREGSFIMRIVYCNFQTCPASLTWHFINFRYSHFWDLNLFMSVFICILLLIISWDNDGKKTGYSASERLAKQWSGKAEVFSSEFSSTLFMRFLLKSRLSLGKTKYLMEKHAFNWEEPWAEPGSCLRWVYSV